MHCASMEEYSDEQVTVLDFGFNGRNRQILCLNYTLAFYCFYLFHPPILASHIYFMSWDIDDIWGPLI